MTSAAVIKVTRAMGNARSRDRRAAPVPEFWNERDPSGTSRVERPPREAASAHRSVVRSVLLRVFELGSCLQGVLRHSWQDDLVHLLLELRPRHRDVVLAHSQKAADADNGVRE